MDYYRACENVRSNKVGEIKAGLDHLQIMMDDKSQVYDYDELRFNMAMGHYRLKNLKTLAEMYEVDQNPRVGALYELLLYDGHDIIKIASENKSKNIVRLLTSSLAAGTILTLLLW